MAIDEGNIPPELLQRTLYWIDELRAKQIDKNSLFFKALEEARRLQDCEG